VGSAARRADLELRGEITPELEEALVARLDTLAASGAPRVRLYVNSGGGSVMAGIGLHSALRRYPGGIDTWTDGIVASMATVVFLAGEKRRVATGSWLMLHGPWLASMGDSEALRRDAAMLDRLAMTLGEILVGRTGQPDDVAALWLTGENWFSSSQALEFGLATEIEGAAAAAALVAVPMGRFSAVPAALARLSQETSKMTTAEAAGTTAGGNVNDAVMLERARVSELNNPRLQGEGFRRGRFEIDRRPRPVRLPAR
jgi:ATP-dependent protease ClpP protease subunit